MALNMTFYRWVLNLDVVSPVVASLLDARIGNPAEKSILVCAATSCQNTGQTCQADRTSFIGGRLFSYFPRLFL